MSHNAPHTQTAPLAAPKAAQRSQLVVVGSTNPTKIAATSQAFRQVWPDVAWHFEGIDTPTNAPDQPFSGMETYNGAEQRAQIAVSDRRQPAFGVGIEGGLFRAHNRWMECGWVVIIDQDNTIGVGTSPSIMVPDEFVHQMSGNNRKTLGAICDETFDRTDVGLAEGYFGIMTNNAVTRTSGYVPGIVFALARFVHPELF